MDYSIVFNRLVGLFTDPKGEWDKIRTEQFVSPTEVITKYVIPLALIPAILHVIFSLRFILLFGLFLRWGILGAIFQLIIGVVTVIINGYIINALAPTFRSRPDAMAATKLAAFAAFPAFVATIFMAIPLRVFHILGLVGLYGLYLLYLGLPLLMETPKERVVSYIVVLIIVWIVIAGLLSYISWSILGVPAGYMTYPY